MTRKKENVVSSLQLVDSTFIVAKITFHYYRIGIWSLLFVPVKVGPGTNLGISPGSNG